MKIYRIASGKFTTNGTYKCLKCGEPLLFNGEVSENPNHIWNPGLNYVCQCGSSSMWTNSVRDMNELVKCKEENISSYDELEGSYKGFCNDQYCGKCLSKWDILKMGGHITPSKEGSAYSYQFHDISGCEKCGVEAYMDESGIGKLSEKEGQNELLRLWLTLI